ncbi:MAG: purine-binding chemotaxis protein CheW [Ruminiclostridium sp.]|nr:purine-binding chemotaxis protein CheW [Ruminiclostridium sp.]
MDIKELFAKQEEMKRKNLNARTEKESEITKVLTFFIGEQVYGIEIPMVIEIIGVPHITVVPGIPYYIKGIINVRSKVVPVIDMRSRFGKEEKEYNERTNTIIIEESGVTVGVIVDEVIGVIPVYQKNIANSPDRIGVNDNKFIKYLLEMQDGIKLVLDVAKLIYDGDMIIGDE